MKYKLILITSFVGLVICSVVAFSPWDAFYRSKLSGDQTKSVYVGNFPVWMGNIMGLDGAQETVKKRISYHSDRIKEYENKALTPGANQSELKRKIAVHEKERKGLLDFLFGSGDEDD